MTLYEFDEELYLKCLREDCIEEGRAQEKVNTLREMKRAEAAEAEVKRLKEIIEKMEKEKIS